jgi:hypothetical protein
MACRRLILAACVAVVALGAASWWYSDRLTDEERQLVGTWRTKTPYGSITGTMCFGADHRMQITRQLKIASASPVIATETGRWSFRERSLSVDYEHNAIRRALRPFCIYLGINVGYVSSTTMESVTTDEIVTPAPRGGPGEVWTRVRED